MTVHTITENQRLYADVVKCVLSASQAIDAGIRRTRSGSTELSMNLLVREAQRGDTVLIGHDVAPLVRGIEDRVQGHVVEIIRDDPQLPMNVLPAIEGLRVLRAAPQAQKGSTWAPLVDLIAARERTRRNSSPHRSFYAA